MRIPRLTPETMSAEQRAVYDRVVSGPRGALHGLRAIGPIMTNAAAPGLGL